MKQILELAFTVITISNIFFSCSTDPLNNNSNCDSPAYNNIFGQIVGTSTYDQIKTLFGAEGDNFRNDYNGTDLTKFYKWYPCSNRNNYFIECWFMNGKLILSHKTIRNNSCSNNISSQTFQSISNGMTHAEVKAILSDEGDNFRNDYYYPASNEKIKFYRFYNCADQSKYIEVWFYTGIGANLITKNF